MALRPSGLFTMLISTEDDHPRFATLKDLIRSAMHRDREADCILAPALQPLSFQGLFDHVWHIEAQLRAAGIGPGDCVASALPCGVDAATAFIALASSCLYAPLNPADDENALELAFAHLSPTAVVLKSGDSTPARAAAERAGIEVIELRSPNGYEAGRFEIVIPKAASTRHPLEHEQTPGLLMQTSGTTGRPKFVRHTQATLFHAAKFLIRAHQLSPADRCLNMSPLFHSLGLLGSVLIAIVSGGSVVCTPGFDREKFFRWIEDYSPTWFSAVPAIQVAIAELAAKRQDTLRRHPIRFSRSVGANLPEETRRKIEETLHATVVQAYGMSECPPITVDPLPPALRKPGSVGVLAGPEVEIWDDGGARLGPNCSGHVVTRGPNITPGYYKDEPANAAAFTKGWFRTGDCGYLDEDGFLFLTGRVREFINRGGEKVSPSEVDGVFSGHPDVAQAVTFAIHDDRLGEEVATAIVPRHAGALTVKQLTRFAATRLAFHKIPRRIYFVAAIPAGRTGKPDRTALQARLDGVPWQPEEQQVPHVEPRTDLEKKIAKVWTDVLGIANPGIHDNFFDCGGDSLAAVTFLAGLAEVVGTEKPALGCLAEAPTIVEMAELLSRPGKVAHSSLLPLQPAGSGAPLFWIAGFAAVSVVKSLDRNRPVFLVPLPDTPDPEAIDIIAQYAEGCCQILRRFRPKGPYLLAGWCAAGVIALEVARRLEDEGEGVGLILLDARGVLRRHTGFVESFWISTVRATQKLRYHLEKTMRVSAPHVVAYMAGRMHTLLGRLRGSLLCGWRRLLVFSGSDLPAVLQNGQLLFSISLRHYQPKPYLGRIVHIWAADRPKGRFRDLDYEWGSVGKGHMELYEAPGNHVTMFQGENGRALGAVLNDCLNQFEPDSRLNSAS